MRGILHALEKHPALLSHKSPEVSALIKGLGEFMGEYQPLMQEWAAGPSAAVGGPEDA